MLCLLPALTQVHAAGDCFRSCQLNALFKKTLGDEQYKIIQMEKANMSACSDAPVSVQLRFAVSLEDHAIDSLVNPDGPLFHRWLPNGQDDAIALYTSDTRNQLKVWFERKGYLENSFIKYDPVRTEVDEPTMRGQCIFYVDPDTELTALRENSAGSDEYIALGKRVIEYLYPPLAKFIDLLRNQYGQYWLQELQTWNVRYLSLGTYCSSTLRLHWRENDAQPWRPFYPTLHSVTMYALRRPARGYGEYLTESDWQRIAVSVQSDRDIPIALKVIGRAHQLHDSGHISEAFMQAVTGLEMAMGHFRQVHWAGLDLKAKNSKDESLILQLQILAKKTPVRLQDSYVNLAKQAIRTRNKIVHEGLIPSDPGRKMFLSVLHCAKTFLEIDELKVPVLEPSNELAPPDPGVQTSLTHGGITLAEKPSPGNK